MRATVLTKIINAQYSIVNCGQSCTVNLKDVLLYTDVTFA